MDNSNKKQNTPDKNQVKQNSQQLPDELKQQIIKKRKSEITLGLYLSMHMNFFQVQQNLITLDDYVQVTEEQVKTVQKQFKDASK